jgi:BioD-like phosphotransacetylase family protein
MSYLFISSTGDHAGQSLVACAVAFRLMEKKISPGFFKPFGTGFIHIDDIWTDPDAYLFKKILNIQEPLEMICPYLGSEEAETRHGPVEILEKIKSLIHELSKRKDIVLILGSKHIFFDDAPYSLPDIPIISELDAELVLIHRYRQISTTLYSILSVHSLLKDRVKGVIINRVPHDQISDVKGQIMSVLNQQGIFNIAVLPEDPFLSLRTIEEIREVLNGQTICGEEYLDRSVGGMTVGMSGMDKGLMIFKRIYNKIILLEPSTTTRKIAGILLTGNREPPRQVLEAAKKSKIPLILVNDDSFVAQERLGENVAAISPKDQKKITHFINMLDRDDFLNRLIQLL